MPDKNKPKRRRKLTDCKYWKPSGKKTHYCTVDENNQLKQCYGVCKLFCNIKST